MNEHENLLNPNNYKILIQQKKNRRKKLKTQYLTSNFDYSENINDAMIFKTFDEAEKTLLMLKSNVYQNNLRVLIHYVDNKINT